MPEEAWGEGDARRGLLLLRRREVLVDHVAVGLEPLGGLDELAALDRPHLHPAAALMIERRQLHRRHHATERKALDRLHAVLDVDRVRPRPALGLDGVTRG